MGKNKKKRNKVYKGVDAAVTKPIVTRIEAVNRNKVAQWWLDKKKIVKPILIVSGIATFIVIIIAQIISLF